METPAFRPGRESALQLDAADRLAPYRQQFVVDEPDLIYLDGSSLGRLPRAALRRMHEVVQSEWGQRLIRGWNEGWYASPARVGEKIAHLIGAGPDQVTVSDSTSVNLFKLTMAALALRPERRTIVSDDLNFPSDLYVLQGCCNLAGPQRSLKLASSKDGIAGDEDSLLTRIDHETAVVSLSHVAFKSGYLYDAEGVTAKAHEEGALVVWDLCHSVGVVPIELDRWGVDFAVGCTYKYLNGGPGAPAFLYARRDLQDVATSPICGWFGQRAPFAFGLDYIPASGIARFLAGSPPILSLLAMEAGLDIVLEAGVVPVRQKSMLLSSYLIGLVDSVLAPLGFTLGSPRDAQRRGSHISVRHPEGYRINRALVEEMKVISDFREPDNIRLGLSPLYTSFVEVWDAVCRIQKVVEERRYLRYPAERLQVT